MQVSVQTTGPLERRVTVDVPEERISGAVEERLESMSRTSRIRGFRPGKAPMRVIRQRFGSQVRREVIEKLVNTSFFEAVSREDLKPAGVLSIDPLREEPGAGLSYTATFEVMPEISLKPVEDLQVEKPACVIAEDDVDRMVEKLRRQRREFRAVERAARKGDRVNIDYQGLVDGEASENLNSKAVALEIGERLAIPGLEEGLEGAAAGQSLELRPTFPDDFANRELAGKPVVLQVQVNRVEEAVLPDLDEKFFEAFGVTEGGEQAFRQAIRDHMGRELETALRERYRDSIMQALYETNEIEVPNTLVDAEFARMRDILSGNLKMRGVAEDDISRFIAVEELKKTARRRIALQLLTGELIRAHELQAKPEKVREIIEKRAQSYEDAAAFINWFYHDKERLAEVESLALEDEVIDCISSRGKVKELSMSFDELVNRGQTGTLSS